MSWAGWWGIGAAWHLRPFKNMPVFWKSWRCGKFWHWESWSLQNFGARNWPSFKEARPGLLPMHPVMVQGKDQLCSYLGPQPSSAFQSFLLPEKTCEIFPWRACCVEATGNKGLLQRVPAEGEVGVHLTIRGFQTTCYFSQMFSKAGLVHSVWEVFYLLIFLFLVWMVFHCE